jgi:hypothetical protein
VDGEAEEEEEEGLQAGLGDFGFGTSSNIKDRDDEVVSYSQCVCVRTCAHDVYSVRLLYHVEILINN